MRSSLKIIYSCGRTKGSREDAYFRKATCSAVNSGSSPSPVGIVVVAIPKHQEEKTAFQETEATIDSAAIAASKEASERLAFWFPHHDSLNHGLVLVAEELWRLDSAAANSNTIGRIMWQERCEKALSHCFDSIHPGSNLSKIQKADSMLTEIAVFFEQYADYSTMGMIVNIDLQNDFLIYRMAAEAGCIRKYEPSFVDELNAWDGFQNALNDFCLGVVNWDWFGGSGAGPASLAERNVLLQCRLDDLKRIHKQYRREFALRIYDREDIRKDIDRHHDQAKADFRKAVDKVGNSITKDDDVKEYLSEERLDAYNALFDKIQASRKPLVKAFDEWMKVRNTFPKGQSNVQRAAKNKFKENTAIMIDSIAKCILECQMEG